jgi:3-hydroxyacyl-[acyl-carrier-protein] dehydratase
VTRSCTLGFAPDHPTAAGHFPGHPIMPGALLLDEVVLAIAAGEGGKAGAPTVRSAKFLHPVRPGDRLALRWDGDAAEEVRFECFLLDPERLALSGAVRLDTLAP